MDWQDFLFFHIINTHGIPQAYRNLGMSGTLKGCVVFESRKNHDLGLHMHRQEVMTPSAILLHISANAPSAHVQQQQIVMYVEYLESKYYS